MSDSSGVEGIEELRAKFRSLTEAVQGEGLAAAVKAGGLVILNAARGNIKKRGLIRTRTLSRSLHEEVVEQGKERIVLEIGTNLEYAAIHEFGGTIRSKRGKYLAIPVGSYTGSPLEHGDLAVRKTGGGSLVMVDGAGSVQYVLKTSVTIPARPYLRPAVDENRDKAMREMGEALRDVILKAVR